MQKKSDFDFLSLHELTILVDFCMDSLLTVLPPRKYAYSIVFSIHFPLYWQKNMLKNQHPLNLVIISVFLMTLLFDSGIQ